MRLKPFYILFFISCTLFSQSSNWVPQNSGVTSQLDKVDFINANTGIVAEPWDYILRTSNGGTNWTRIYTGLTGQYAVKFKDVNTVFIFGYTTLYKSTNGGLNFTGLINFGSSISDIFIFGETLIFAGGSYIFKSTDAGSSWLNYAASNSPYNVFFINENTAWSIGAQYYPPPNPNMNIYNRIHKTTNGGVNWNLRSEITSQSQPMYQNIRFCDENTGYIGGLYGCRKSTDGGSTWNVVRSGISNEVYPINKDTVWLGSLSSGLYLTTNGGINWSMDSVNARVNDMSILDKNTAWVVGNNGKIYVTSTAFLSTGNSNLIVPGEYLLLQNYPNPFNPSTGIEFSIPERTFIRLAVYDILGRETEVLINHVMTEGSHKIEWNGSNYPSGIYFYTLTSEKFSETKKMILIK